jgi:hypothetical protein
MAWLFRHKFLTLLLIAGAAYFYVNPAGRIGISRPGIIIYNRIPAVWFDCYISPDGKFYPESDLSQPSSVKYWFEEHLTAFRNPVPGVIPLFIGGGFDDSTRITIDRDILRQCRERAFEPHCSSTPAAIGKFNELMKEGKKAAILLKVK